MVLQRMRRVVLILSLGFAVCIFSGVAEADKGTGDKETTVVFNMTNNGYPPFMIPANKDTSPAGIIYDVFKRILEKHGLAVETVFVPKNREVRFFQLGFLDAHATAIEWIENPENFVFTNSILPVRNVIFSRVDAPVQFDRVEDLFGKRLVTRLGFKYPPLMSFFSEGLIDRLNTTSDLSMLRMVLEERGNGAILNDAVGAWIIKENQLEGQLKTSDRPLTDYGYRIMFSKKWRHFVEPFNMELEKMRKNGELEQICLRYGYKLPKNN